MAADDELSGLVARALARLTRAVSAEVVEARREAWSALALASDFAIDTLCRQPDLIVRLDAPFDALPVLELEQEADWPRLLRRWRAAESTRLVWRDLQQLDSVDQTLAGCSRIADDALARTLAALEQAFALRHGHVRDGHGEPQSLVVFGLGKLGGGELNFSSDVDLVYAFAEQGQSDGARPLDAETYYMRLGQRLAQLLGDVTADGFSHRVDLRLRPFGSAGRLALSFNAMEQYFQREGRDWERYAWVKARPVAGDVIAGERLLEMLRPFVYRRYLDYTALDGLREMKALIAAEVQKRELSDHLKLGPGGIREIEFLVQALQLIRGGREPALRQRALLPALAALSAGGHLSTPTADALAAAYRFLRRVENRVQMLADQQTHALPDDPLARLRIARGLGYPTPEDLQRELDGHRERVAEEFAHLLEARRRRITPNALSQYWRGLDESDEVGPLAEAGFADASALHAALQDFARGPAVRALSARARQRLDEVVPALIDAAARSAAPDAALMRGLAVLQSISRRTSYLALLEEQPVALARLIDVVARSALLAERLVAHPLLLDELLDARAVSAPPDRDEIEQRVRESVAACSPDDIEATLAALAELRQSLSFRIAMAVLGGKQPAVESARQLGWLAEAILRATRVLAEAEIAKAHGRIGHRGFAVIGYGSVGANELGFGSDLDLVFLHDATPADVSDGARPLDAPRYYARLAQKLISLLGTIGAAGRLYEVDMRLRPDGAKGLLVSTLDSFADYQRERAWTWERQALVRARAIAGDDVVTAAFERIRRETLAQSRDAATLAEDVVAMRRRMRAELDRSDARQFDLKQGEGGLVDLEFLLQARVLARSAALPELIAPRHTRDLIDTLEAAGDLPENEAQALRDAHAQLLSRALDCTLDRRPRLCPDDEAIAPARAAVRAACMAHGLDFSPA